MKKIVLFIIMALVLPIAMSSVFGQVSSKTRHLLSPIGSKEILRIHTGDNTLTYRNSPDTLTHSFYYCSSLSSKFTYSLPSIANLYGNGIYTVNDMLILGNKCFICGKLKMPIGEIEPPQTYRDLIYSEDMGYIGMIDLDSIDNFFNGNIKVKYSLVIKTVEILKMAVLGNSPDTLIGMIGFANNIEKTSCLVAMKGGGSSWSNKVYALPDLTETLTDIVFTEKSLVTASRFYGEPWSFGVRYVNYSDLFYNNQINEYRQVTKFNTQNMHTSTNTYPTWHLNDAMIRMVAIPGGNDVTIGYKGRVFLTQDSTDWTEKLPLFYINGNSAPYVTMTNAKMTFALQGVNGSETFLDIKYVSSNNTIPILQHTNRNTSNPSLVLFFSWNSTSHIYESPGDPYRWSSLDIVGDNLWIGGAETSSNSIIQNYFNQQNTSWFCYFGGEDSSSQLSEPITETLYSDVALLHSTNLIEWVHKSRVTGLRRTYTQPCIDYGDRGDQDAVEIFNNE